jgi:hypothetical protein
VSTTRLGRREKELRVANPAGNPALASYPSASPVLSNLENWLSSKPPSKSPILDIEKELREIYYDKQ